MPVAHHLSSIPSTPGGLNPPPALVPVASAPAAIHSSTPPPLQPPPPISPAYPSSSSSLGLDPVPLQPPSPSMSGSSVAAPSTPWNSRFFIDIDAAPGLSPSLSHGFSRCTSEPPSHIPEMGVRRHQRSRSASRTPSSPLDGSSRTDLKSLPVTPKVTSPATIEMAPTGPDDDVHMPSEPTSPYRARAGPTPRSSRRPVLDHTLSQDVLGLQHSAPHPLATAGMGLGSTPVTPDERLERELHHQIHQHNQQHANVRKAWNNCHGSARLLSTQYSDLFLLEPHEYDSITDGELVRLYDRGIIEGHVLEQIVDASIRIQRAVTDADRAVSVKTRRAMIRHALED